MNFAHPCTSRDRARVSPRHLLQPLRLRAILIGPIVALLLITPCLVAKVTAQRPLVADPNVNMVRGIGGFINGKFDGDPYLQRQNEPSLAVSTRNPCHLLAGANDYRLVDHALDGTPLPNTTPQTAADAWLGLFKSFDCGNKWQSTMVPGYPGDPSAEGAPLQGFQAGADPTVRAGSNGLFYYSGIVLNRGDKGQSRLFVARYQDFNNKERGDTIGLLGVTPVADGSSGQFVDKPWMAVDVPRPGQAGVCDVPADPATGRTAQRFDTGPVYLAWTRFDGNSAKSPSKVMFGRSDDCGRTFKSSPISDNQQVSQGAMIAIAPDDGTVYVAWREFGRSGKPSSIRILRSANGGQTWDKLGPVVAAFTPFDQGSSGATFRTSALPTIAAAPGGLVYVAFAGRGYHTEAGGQALSTDSRIVLAVSINGGRTFAAPYAIDNPTDRGHQIMPALAYAAGMIQIAFYDFRHDLGGFGTYIDESAAGVRHTVDVRAAWAEPGPHPVFRAQVQDGAANSLRLTQFATKPSTSSGVLGHVQVRWNAVNLPLYGQGKVPFIGDYLDTQALFAVPVRSADGLRQDWKPALGPTNADGKSPFDPRAFAPLPVFHTAWTDNRDVMSPPAGKTWADYTAPGDSAGTCDPVLRGIRDANIYTSRMTPGLFVGSPGNTKPLGKVLNTKTGQLELIQRGFAVFVQNTARTTKRFRLTIVDQPAGGRASFRQFDVDRKTGTDRGALAVLEAVIPPRSTIARTVYAKAVEKYAQILINVEEVDLADPVNAPEARLHALTAGGLKASVLLNPDLTNPEILDPDFVSGGQPEIASMESHDVGISAPVYMKLLKWAGMTLNRAIGVPQSPDIENPDIENPDIENPDIENPDIENPDIENPDIENPDIENPDIENSSISAMGDVQWTVKNKGNTTSAYRFRPTLKTVPPGLRFQLIVTRRYLLPTVNAVTCQPRFRVENQVIVSIPNYTPRTPDIENPDIENPDIENPDIENPAFLLAPGESATVTLRLIKTRSATSSVGAAEAAMAGPADMDLDAFARLIAQGDDDIDFSPRQQTGAVVVPQAADTGQTAPSSAAAGADLVLSDPMPTLNTAQMVPPGQVTLTFTISNRGTGEAVAYVNGTPPSETSIKTRFYLSTDNVLSTDDVPLAPPGHVGSPYTFFHAGPTLISACTDLEPDVCKVARTQVLAIPPVLLSGQYYVFAIVDDDNDWDDDTVNFVDNEVFEADDYNNRASAELSIGYQLTFAVQPVATTLDMFITPATIVSVLDAGGTPVSSAIVPAVSLVLGGNPAGGSFSGTLIAPNVNGFATFADLRINNAGSPYTLVATAPNAFSVMSAPFGIEPDAPPAVANDTFSVLEEATLVVPPPVNGVLANDSDPAFKGTKQPTRNPRPSPGCPAGSCLQATLVTAPAHGVLLDAGGDVVSAIGLDGSFRYRPNPGFFGTDTFTYLANDGRPGNNTSGTVTITVVGVNDPPSFTKGPDHSVNEDSGLQSLPGWATGISAGPGEATQSVDFIVTNDSPALFAVQPSIGATGSLTYRPAPEAHGTATVTVRLHDNGGTDHGGTDTSDPQTFVITVIEVNDPPVAAPDTLSTGEDAPIEFSTSLLTGNDSPGPADEIGQTLAVAAVSATAGTHGTVVLAGGAITYAPASGYNGPASFSYTVCDNGTPSQCATGVVSVTVAAINDPPVPAPDAAATAEDTPLLLAAATLVSNDSRGPADENGQTLAVTAVAATAATHGTVALAAGTITYAPEANYNGLASFAYTVCDSGTPSQCADGVVNVTVTAVNDPPVAGADTKTAVEDTPLAFPASDLTANDSPGPGDPVQTLTVTAVAATADTHGTVALAAGQITYTPAGNFLGPARFIYTVCDNGTPQQCATGAVDVTVSGRNDPPSFAAGANRSATEDGGLQTVTGWATGISPGPPDEAEQLVDFLVSNNNGALFAIQPAIGPTGTLTYTPAADAFGSATVTVRLHDNGGTANGGIDTSAPQTFTITVTAVNDPPTFTPGANQTVDEDSGARTVTGWATSISPGPANEAGQSLTFVTTAGNPSMFSVQPAIGATGTLTFTPAANANGVATVTVQLRDNGGTADGGVDLSSPRTFTITIRPTNDPPTAVNDNLAVAAGSLGAPLDVLANDSSAPDSGETLTITAVSDPPHGMTSITPAGVTYVPDTGYTGADSFTYTIADGNGGSATATVSVTVTTNRAPTAVPDAAATLEDIAVSVSVLDNDTDPENDRLEIAAASAPPGATAVISANRRVLTYTPPPNANGVSTFTYTARDVVGNTATGTVTVTVTAVADPPIFVAGASQTIAEDSGLQTVPGWATGISAGPPDESTQAVDFLVTNNNAGLFAVQPAIGQTGTLTYTPAANANGVATVTVRLHDNGGTANGGLDTSAPQTFTITVTAVNDAPTFTGGANQTVNEDSGARTVTGWATGISAGPANEAGQSLTFAATTDTPSLFSIQPAVGATGTLTFTPAANANGAATVTVVLRDNGGTAGGGVDASAPRTFTITVQPVNDPPTAVNDTAAVAAGHASLAIFVLANDSSAPDSGETLSVTAVSDPPHGTASFTAAAVAYTPDAGYAGADSFTYTVNDGHGGTATATVSVTVTLNHAPAGVADTATTTEDTAVSIPVLANDSDPDGDALTVSAVSSAGRGTVTITGGGTGVSYRPSLNLNGTDTFTYTATDGFGGSATATVTVSVAPVNDAPVAANDAAMAIAGTTAAIDVLANDTDAESRLGLSIAAAVPQLPPGMTSSIRSPSELAVVPGAARLYAASLRAIAVYRLADTTLDTTIPLPAVTSPGLHRLDAAAGVLYFRYGSGLVAIDVRPQSPTFNKLLGSFTFGGNVVSYAVDDARHRVYAIHAINAGGAPSSRHLAVLDGDPTSPGFLTQLTSVPMLGTPTGIAVNAATDRVYVSSSSVSPGGNPPWTGISVIDGSTLSVTQLTGAPACYDVVVEPSMNMVYGIATTSPDANVVAVDGGTSAVTVIPVPNFWVISTPAKALAVNATTHRVYVRGADFTNPGTVAVIDANRANTTTFDTIVARIQTERDYCDIVVDEVHNRVVTTGDMGAIVIDGSTNVVTGIVRGKQLTCDIAVNPQSGLAYATATSAGFLVLNTAGTPAAVASVVTSSEVIGVVVDPSRHIAYTPRTSGTASLLTIARDGQVAVVPGLPTDAGRFLTIARNGTTGKIYAVNYSAGLTGGMPFPGFVSVIDGSTRSVIKSITVGDQPLGIGINEATNRIYVANNTSPGTVSVIDGSTDALVATVTSPHTSIRFQGEIAANVATNRMYLRSTTSVSPLWVIDGATNALSPVTLPAGTATVAVLRVNAEKYRVYVAMSDGTFHVLDGANDSIIRTLVAGYPSTSIGTQSYVAVNEATDQVFVADFLRDEVTVLDKDGVVLETVEVGDGPTAVAVNEITNRIYVSSTTDRILVVLDGATRQLRSAIQLPWQANFLAVDPGDARIYASTSGTPPEIGMMVVADEPAGPNGTLSVAGVTPGAQGTTQTVLDRIVLYQPGAGATGVDTFTYTASDGQAVSAPATVTVTISPALAIATTSLPNGRRGEPYSRAVLATGGTGPLAWFVVGGGIPGGTTMDNATGVIVGTPTTPGLYMFTVRVQDSAAVPQVATQVLTIGVGPIVVTTGSLASGFVGQAYSRTLTAAPIVGTAVWSLVSGTLPPGLLLGADGVISGTSTVYGSSSFTVGVTDGSGESATRALSIFINAPLAIVEPLRDAVLFSSYSTGYVGGNGQRQWTVTGTLPRGMSVSATSGITGTPLETGSFPLSVTLADCANNSCTYGIPVQTVGPRDVTLRVVARDQQVGGGGSSLIPFGTAGYERVAQIVTTGATGTLAAVQPNSLTCPLGTVVTAEIRRLTSTPPFVPDDSPGGLLASGTVVTPSAMVSFAAPPFLPVGTRFAVILTAAGACQTRTYTAGDSYIGGEPFAFAGTWQTPADFVELGLDTYVLPQGLAYTTASRSNTPVATPLLDGRILVSSDGSAEVYDPATGRFTATANNLQVSRSTHAAVRLECPSGTGCGYHGKVLVAGGDRYDSILLRRVVSNTADLYDPATNQFTPLAGTLSVGRYDFTMTRLTDGRVLLAGGQTRDPATGSSQTIRSAEIFDPATMSFAPVGDMLMTRRQHTATLISCSGCAADGRVLIVGGFGGSWNGPGPMPTAEIFDPAGGTFSATTGGTLGGFSRSEHTATPLANGNVVIAGGIGWWPDLNSTIEVYDVATGSFASAGSMVVPRRRHAAALLADGRVLMAGGWEQRYGSSQVLSPVEIYDPVAGASVAAGHLIVGRAQHQAVRLGCPAGSPGCAYENDVFIVGGSGTSALAPRSAEIRDVHAPGSTLAITTMSLPDGQTGQPYPGATLAAAGGTPPYTFATASGSLPPQVVLEPATGQIHAASGTNLDTPGAFQFVAQVTDSLGAQAYQSLLIRVNVPTITTATLPSGIVGQAYDATLDAAGAAPYAWSYDTSVGIPPGLSVLANGHVSGTPTSLGCWTISVRVRDASFQTVTKSLNLCINNPLDITVPTSQTDAVLLEWLDRWFSTSGGAQPTWSLALQPGEHVPDGLALTSSGRLQGYARETGTFTFTVRATDASSPPQTDSQELTLRVVAKDQQVGGGGSSTVPFGTTGYERIAQIVTAGATGTLAAVRPWSLTCAWPATITAEIRRLTATPPFVPDDTPGGLIASTTVTSGDMMSFAAPPFLPIGARVAVVLTASGSCQTRAYTTGDSYLGGEPFVFAGTWQTPAEFVELGLDTYVLPQGLSYLTASRYNAVATPLLDGRILVSSDGSAEVYDPATGRFTATANSLQVFRSSHAAVRLECPSGTGCGYHGLVLIAGGDRYDSTLNRRFASNTAELYDPATNLFTPVAGTLAVGRLQFTMTRLADGRVLLAGGQTYDPATGYGLSTRSAEIFDPAAMSFAPVGDMLAARRQHTATLVSCSGCAGDGKVLIVGGWADGGTTAELFEPSTHTFRATAGGTVDGYVRAGHTATALPNGNIVIAGGIGQWPDLGGTIEVYDVETDRFTAAGAMATLRMNAAAVPLADGRVLIAGGSDRWVGSALPVPAVEIWDPASGTSTAAGNLLVSRVQAQGIRLACAPGSPDCSYENDVLIVGGNSGGSNSSLSARSAEILGLHTPAGTLGLTTLSLPDGQTGQPYPGATLAATGGTAPYTFAIASGSLPPRIILDPTSGLIHSLPGDTLTTAGAFQFVAQVTDSLGVQAFQSLTIRVNLLVITTAALPSGILGQPYDAILDAAGTAPYVWSYDTSVGGPPGLTVLADGHVSGTPTALGCWSFGARARDASYQTALKAFNVCINQPLTITSANVFAYARVLEWYDQWIGATGGGPRTWAFALQPGEHVPDGLALTSNGRLQGSSREAGIFTFTVQATDASSPPQSASAQVTLHIGVGDQGQWQIEPSLTLPIDSGHQAAQVVRAGVTGRLISVGVPVACTSGDLTLEIQGVTGAGTPNGSLRASVAVPGAQLQPFSGGPYHRIIPLPAPPSFTVDESYAIVLASSGSCTIAPTTEVQYRSWAYRYGDAFTGDGSTWTSLGPTSRPVLPFQATMDPEGRLTFAYNWRDRHTATVLNNGTVLLAGGTGGAQPRAVIYDPAANTYTQTAGDMLAPRHRHTATKLPDGRVLIVGGQDWSSPSEQTLATTEIYDPGTGQFTLGPSLATARGDHTATLLADGRVLVAGGHDGWNQTYQRLATTEIYDGMSFTAGPTLAAARDIHTATRLADNRVLIVGGEGWIEPHAEVYDPDTNLLTSTGLMTVPRSEHTATLLTCPPANPSCGYGGKVLVVGGWAGNQPGAAPIAELYDPATNTFAVASGFLQTRQRHTATALTNGKILIAGGRAVTGESLAPLELYDPATGQFTPAGVLATSRHEHTATLLPDGRVLLAFGNGSSNAIGISSEIYDPENPPPAGAVAIQMSDPPHAYVGRPYDVQLTATGVGPFTWGLAPGSQPLPAGLSLSSDGRLTGTPAAPTGWPVYPFTVRAVDAEGRSTTRSFGVVVDPPLEITTTALLDAVVTDGYGGCLSVSGGSGAIALSVIGGALPPGLALSPNGCWSGQLRDVGTYTFTVRATDSAIQPQVAVRELTIRSWAADQQGPGGDWQNTLPISGSQRVAQTVTAGALGDLAAVRVPVSCSEGAYTVEIQGVTPASPYQPDGVVHLSAEVTPTDPWAPIVFGATKFFGPGERFAIVLSSAGSCQISGLHPTSTYNEGEAWTTAGGAWLPLSDSGYQDLNFTTLIVPARDLDYLRFGQWGDFAVVLDDGRVFLGPGSQTEIYDPAAHLTTPGPVLSESRGGHTVTRLADGRVATIGGEQWDSNTFLLRATAEIYDPATGQFSTASGRLAFPRSHHTATLLANGQVLIAGGLGMPDPARGGFRPPFRAAEVFDPATGQFTALTNPASLMVGSRWGHRATALEDGTVLITGGWNDNWPAAEAEIFDPATSTFAATAHPMLLQRGYHSATRLADGRVLIAGGEAANSSGVAATAEIYDPATGTFTAAGAMAAPRVYHAAVLLNDGSVLVAGGSNSCCGQPWHSLASLERFDPVLQTFLPAGSMVAIRSSSNAAQLNDGRVAIVGGSGSRLSWGAIEFYEPGAGVAITTTSLPDTLIGQAYPASTLMATGGIPPYVFSIVGSSLPPGLNLAGSVISGTSTAAGTYPFTVMVTDNSGPAHSNYQSLSIFVAAPLAIQAASLPDAVAGQAYAQPITATGGLGTRIWSVVTGALPPGTTVAPDGTVTGIASVTGAFTFTVRVQTPSGFDEEQFNLTVVAPVPGNESIWTTTFPPGGSIVAGGLDIDPTSAGGDLYAAPAMRGLYKSTDAGTGWASILDHVQTLPFDRSGINNMAFGPTGVLYVMAHGSIYRSHDRGGTWTWSSAGLGQWVMSVLPATSSVLYAATSVAGVYRSTDGGTSWTAANSGLPLETIWALTAVPGSSNVIYAGTEYSGLFRTTDGGDTWAAVAVASGSPLTRVEAVAIDPLLPSRMYVTGSSSGQDGMWRSVDGGVTWVRLQVPVSNGYRNGKSLAVHPHVAGTVYFLSGNQVLKSVDGGDTWSSAVPFPALFGGATSIRVHPTNNDWVFAGTDSGMYRSLDAGASWEQANAGMRAVSLPHSAAHSVHVDLSDANYVYAGTNGGGYRSVNGGQAWETMGLPESWARSILTSPAAPGRVYALSGNLWRSDSNGASGSWVQPDGGGYCCSGDGDLALHPTDPNTLYRAMTGAQGGSLTGVLKSTNGGATWAAAGMASLSVHALAVSPADGSIVYAAVPTWSGPNSGIYKTTDGGTTWVKLTGGLPTEINPNQIIVHPLYPWIVYVGSEGANGGVHKSLDGGATWTHVLRENVNSVAIDPANLGTVYAATWNSGGFYRSLDGGSTWAPVNEGLPRQHGLEAIAYAPGDPTRLFLGTTGGVYVRRF